MATWTPIRPAAFNKPSRVGGGTDLAVLYSEHNFTGAIALNETFDVGVVPVGYRVVGMSVSSTDLDTGGSPAVIIAFGDVADDDRLMTGLNIGQAGGTSTAMALTGHGWAPTVDTLIQGKCTTAPQTSATSGTVRVAVFMARVLN